MSLKNSGLSKLLVKCFYLNLCGRQPYQSPRDPKNAHPTIKLESEYSRQEMNFLDVAFRLNRSKFIPDQFCKAY